MSLDQGYLRSMKVDDLEMRMRSSILKGAGGATDLALISAEIDRRAKAAARARATARATGAAAPAAATTGAVSEGHGRAREVAVQADEADAVRRKAEQQKAANSTIIYRVTSAPKAGQVYNKNREEVFKLSEDTVFEGNPDSIDSIISTMDLWRTKVGMPIDRREGGAELKIFWGKRLTNWKDFQVVPLPGVLWTSKVIYISIKGDKLKEIVTTLEDKDELMGKLVDTDPYFIKCYSEKIHSPASESKSAAGKIYLMHTIVQGGGYRRSTRRRSTRRRSSRRRSSRRRSSRRKSSRRKSSRRKSSRRKSSRRRSTRRSSRRRRSSKR